MLYVFHGPNTHTAITKATALVNSLRTKKPDASYVRIEAGNWTSSIIEEHLGGQGLFSNKYIILLDRVTENTEAKELLVESIPLMQESTNIFIVVEGKVNAELKKAFDKSAEKVVENEIGEKERGKEGKSESGEFNIFALADAVGQRNAFAAWSIYRQAVDAGTPPENIIGTIFWQLKSMTVAAGGSSAGDAGLSPFVYSKAKKAATNYSPSELQDLTKKFVTLYHDGHRGKVGLEIGVEKILLNIGV